MAIADIVLPVTFKSDPRGLRKAEDELKKFGRSVGRIAAGATAAVGGIAAVSVKAFADFDQKLQESVAIMGNVSDAMRDDMADAAREVAKQTTFSADQAAESFFFLASAGLDAEQSIAALPQVANFAQAGMFDMALATDLLTDAQSALGLTSDDVSENMLNMARVSDVLVGANAMANASVQQFSEALTNRAGAALKAVGKDVEEGVAVLAAFADQGIKGAEAGTRFDMVLRDLQTRAISNKNAFEQFNIQVFDQEGEMRNLGEIVGEVETALGGLSDAEKRAALQTLGFTDRSIASLMALLGTSDAIKEYEDGLRSAGGITDEVANTQLESFSSQLSLLKSAFADVGIEIGSMLVPHLSRLVQSMGPLIAQATPALVSLFLSLMPVIEELIEGFPAFVRALMPLIPIMGEIAGLVAEAAVALFPILVQVLQLLLPVFQTLTTALRDNAALIAIVVASIGGFIAVGTMISQIITIVSAFKVVIGGLGSVFGLLVKGVAFGSKVFAAFHAILLANPLIAIIAAVVALTAGLVYFFTQTDKGKEIWAGFVGFLQDLWRGMQVAFSMLVEDLQQLWTSVVDFFTGAWDGFVSGFETALEGIGDFFKGIINGWISMFEGFVNFLIGAINSVIGALNTISVDVPATAFNEAFTLGINIPKVPEISLPRLAEGGIVDQTTIAMIGEAGPEAVIPLDRLGEMGGRNYNITVNAGMGTDGPQVAEQIVRLIRRYERNSGPVFARA